MQIKAFRLCLGVLALAGMISGCSADATGDATGSETKEATGTTVLHEAVVLADGTEAEKVSVLGGDGAAAASDADTASQASNLAAYSVSFWATCRPTKYYVVRGGSAIIEAYSDSCQRRNGSWGGATRWTGTCYGDIANCNGSLRCGSC